MYIEDIVKNHTMYKHNSKICRRYLSIADLIGLGNAIIEENKTTGYLRFTPFYRNALLGRQIEFDEDFMFYVECRKNVTAEEVNEFIKDCIDGETFFEEAKKQYMLCDVNDVKGFQKSIRTYLDMLPHYVKKIAWQLENVYHVNPKDFLLGSICFEVHCKEHTGDG